MLTNLYSTSKAFKFVSYLYFINTILIILFSRSYVGISLFNKRIGEIIIGGCFAFSLYYFFNLKHENLLLVSRKINIIHKLIIGSFFLSLLINNEYVFNEYLYKSSSIIWTLIFINFGLYLQTKITFTNNMAYITIFLLVILYFLSTSIGTFPYIGEYPNFLKSFFSRFSDKVEAVKASNLLITLIITNLISNKFIKSNKANIFILFSTVSLIIPLLAFNSRGSTLFGILYLIIEIFYRKKILLRYKLTTITSLVSSILIFLLSTFWIFDELNFNKSQPINEIIESIGSSEEKFSEKKNFSPETFLSFYLYEGRIYSEDGTINWRFDIWQDNFDDQKEKGKILLGYGYSSRLPVMNDPEEPGRFGLDGLNEHVHNYFVTTFARGGLVLFVLILSYWIIFIYEYKKKNGNYYIIALILPALLNASFEVAMESVQFPYLFLITSGFLFNIKYEFEN